VQRFGPSPNLHVQLHACARDGVHCSLPPTHAWNESFGMPPGTGRARRGSRARRRRAVRHVPAVDPRDPAIDRLCGISRDLEPTGAA
jgi:hypothetical protein